MKLFLALSSLVASASANRLGSPSNPTSSSSFSSFERHVIARKLTEVCDSSEDTNYPIQGLNSGAGWPDIDGVLASGLYYPDPVSKPDWQGSEYDGFLTIPMYNGGKNMDDGTSQIAEAKIAYDCTTGKLCAAAYYLPCYLSYSCTTGIQESEPVSVLQSDSDSWLSIDGLGGSGKLKGVTYIVDPSDSSFTLGWEACWTGISPSLFDGDVILEVHFNRGGATTSSGKGSSGGTVKGTEIKICGTCDEGCKDPLADAPTCQKYGCDGETLIADRDQNGLDCNNFAESGNECYSATCVEGICVAAQKENGAACEADDYTCCKGVCGPTATGSCAPDTCTITAGCEPSLSEPNIPQGKISDQCALPDLGTRTATLCDGSSETVSPIITSAPTDPTCGDFTVEWTSGQDCEGTSVSDELTYTLVGNANPVLENLPGNANLECGDGFSPLSLGRPTATDDCSTPNVDFSDTQSGDSCSAEISRVWTATDSCGNTDSYTQTIAVIDTKAPVLTRPIDVSFECVGDLSVIPGDAGSASAADCSGFSITSSDSTAGDACAQTTMRTWTATDDCKNSASDVQTIVVQDTTVPSFETFPVNVKVECGADTSTATTGMATGTDTCSSPENVAVTVGTDAVTDDSSTCADNKVVQTITRSFTVTDECGLSTTQTQEITVEDRQAPSFDFLPTNKALECGEDDQDTSPSSTGMAAASDTCRPDGVTITSSDASTPEDTCGPGGLLNTIVRTFTAKDDCENSVKGAQTITISDTKAPVLTLPSNHQLECLADPKTNVGAGQDTTPATLGSASGKDVCPTSTVSINKKDAYNVPEACGDNGLVQQITRSWSATDSCGNEAIGDQVISIVDTTPPALTLPEDKVLECGAEGYDISPTAQGQATESDVCSTSTLEDPVDAPFKPETCSSDDKIMETLTRTWTAVDACGNTASQDQLITTKDTLKPVLQDGPSAQATLLCSSDCIASDGTPLATPGCAGAPPTAEDQCAGTIEEVTVTDTKVDSVSPPGVIYTRTFSAVDPCGNEATQVQTITVEDDCAFEVSDAFSGLSINVGVDIVNVAGGIAITLSVDDDSLIGDLRGLFFQVVGSAEAKVTSVEGSHVTQSIVDDGGITSLARDVRMTGGGNSMPDYNVAVEIGTNGKSRDDIQSTTITVKGLTTDDIADDGYFGIRLTSVGTGDDGREDSSKIYGPATCCRAV